MQAKGNVGKSIETAARACWLNQRGIQWQGFDLDGDNRTLSRLFPGQAKLVPLNGQADDLDELISILRKVNGRAGNAGGPASAFGRAVDERPSRNSLL